VNATGVVGGPVTDTDPSNHFGVAGGINIEKLTNGQDADVATGPVVPVGSTATFTYVVTNTGNAPLSAVVVSDDNGTVGVPGDDFSPTFVSGDTNANGLLDTTETWTYTGSRIVTAGQYTNIGSVSATNSAGAPVSDSDPSNHFGAISTIDIEKLTNGQDADTPTGPQILCQWTVRARHGQ
jgi:uncharacterized repeat protein (TIGR01451 family)